VIADQGVTARAINLEAGQVLVEAPDGKTQICDILGWFAMGGIKVSTYQLAHSFAFEVEGFDRNGVPVSQRYDAILEGLGEPLERDADGTFRAKAARRLDAQVGKS
jgi:hypothetical protein